MYYLALWLYNYVNASAHAGKNKPLNSFKFTCVVYYMGTLTRHSWIHYTVCWIVK